jgi:hypothetical protein
MAVCGRAAAVVVHRETQHIVSGVQAYARQARGVKKSAVSKTVRLFTDSSIAYGILLTIFHCDFLRAKNRRCTDYTQDLVSPAITQVIHIMLTFLLTGCPSLTSRREEKERCLRLEFAHSTTRICA